MKKNKARDAGGEGEVVRGRDRSPPTPEELIVHSQLFMVNEFLAITVPLNHTLLINPISASFIVPDMSV